MDTMAKKKLKQNSSSLADRKSLGKSFCHLTSQWQVYSTAVNVLNRKIDSRCFWREARKKSGSNRSQTQDLAGTI